MSTTLIYAARIVPYSLDCRDCGGSGTVDRIIGTIYTADAILPREETEDCPECEGTGRSACCYCGSRETVEICSDGPTCGCGEEGE